MDAVIASLCFSLNWDKLRGRTSCSHLSQNHGSGWCDRQGKQPPPVSFSRRLRLGVGPAFLLDSISRGRLWTLRRSIRFSSKRCQLRRHRRQGFILRALLPSHRYHALRHPAERTNRPARPSARIAVQVGSRVQRRRLPWDDIVRSVGRAVGVDNSDTGMPVCFASATAKVLFLNVDDEESRSGRTAHFKRITTKRCFPV